MATQPIKTISKPASIKTESDISGLNPGLSALTVTDPVQPAAIQSIQTVYAAKGTQLNDGGRDPFVKPGAP